MTPRRTPFRTDFGTAAVVGAVFFMAAAFGGFSARAQSLNFAGGDSDQPIQVFAEDGIEWQQENLIFVARGKARAVRGTFEVHADVLRAFYRETADGGTDIQRLDAEGSVRIVTPGEKAFGNQGVYQIDNAIFVLSGGNPRFVTDQDVISASRQLEYWEKKQMAVARGNAQATRGNKRLRADILVAYFRRGKNGKTSVHRVDAFDGVMIDTDKDHVKADRGVYNVESGMATLTGRVTLTRGRNTLTGCTARVNLNTGISKLHSCPRTPSGGGRVRGVLRPSKQK
jgi:lipopolysaccharide export system protein LptA